jgi:peroxiredoxin
MKTKIYMSAVILLAVIISFAGLTGGGAPSRVENFKLKDYNGKEYSLSDFRNSKGVVIMFIATQCPVSNGYNDRMAKLYSDYKDKGIVFVGINSNKEESAQEVKAHAKEHNLNFLILKDTGNIVADKFGASVTPETYLLNKDYEILYHGRIDDNRRGDEIKTQDLRNALDQYLSGKKIGVTSTKAFGCSIKRVG